MIIHFTVYSLLLPVKSCWAEDCFYFEICPITDARVLCFGGGKLRPAASSSLSHGDPSCWWRVNGLGERLELELTGSLRWFEDIIVSCEPPEDVRQPRAPVDGGRPVLPAQRQRVLLPERWGSSQGAGPTQPGFLGAGEPRSRHVVLLKGASRDSSSVKRPFFKVKRISENTSLL